MCASSRTINTLRARLLLRAHSMMLERYSSVALRVAFVFVISGNSKIPKDGPAADKKTLTFSLIGFLMLSTKTLRFFFSSGAPYGVVSTAKSFRF